MLLRGLLFACSGFCRLFGTLVDLLAELDDGVDEAAEILPLLRVELLQPLDLLFDVADVLNRRLDHVELRLETCDLLLHHILARLRLFQALQIRIHCF